MTKPLSRIVAEFMSDHWRLPVALVPDAQNLQKSRAEYLEAKAKAEVEKGAFIVVKLEKNEDPPEETEAQKKEKEAPKKPEKFSRPYLANKSHQGTKYSWNYAHGTMDLNFDEDESTWTLPWAMKTPRSKIT